MLHFISSSFHHQLTWGSRTPFDIDDQMGRRSTANIERGLGTERARLIKIESGLCKERVRLGTFRSFGTERARLGTWLWHRTCNTQDF